MAVPTVVGVGAGAGGVGAGPFTVAYPAAYTAVDNDIALIFGETQEASVFTVPTGYAHVTGSPVIATGGGTRLAVFWKRLVAGDAAPSLSLSSGTDHMFARMLVARGVKTAGNPWNAVATGTEITADTSATWPGVTTTVADCLILEAIATGADLATTTMVGALTNANYANIVEQIDQWVGSGDGGGVGVISATMASAGATGQSTATMGTTAAKSLMTLALEPPGAGGTGWTQAVDDAMAATDSSARTLSKAPADAVAVTDTGFDKIVAYVLADAAVMSSSIFLPGAQGWTKSLGDSMAVVGAVSRVWAAKHTEADALAATDAVALPPARRWQMDSENRWLVDVEL